MHKKVQSLIIAGIMLTNTFACAGEVFADSNLETTNDVKLEKTEENEESSTEAVVPKDEWQTVSTVSELSGVWEYIEETKDDGTEVVVLTKYIGASTNTKVEIPREIDGKKVELENIATRVFPGVTDIRVADGNENNKVKLICCAS